MTKEEIIRMALEAGFANVRGGLMDNGELSDYWDCWPKQLERFAALVAAYEREACAKVCEELRDDWLRGRGRYEFMGEGADYCAEAIRARRRG